MQSLRVTPFCPCGLYRTTPVHTYIPAVRGVLKGITSPARSPSPDRLDKGQPAGGNFTYVCISLHLSHLSSANVPFPPLLLPHLIGPPPPLRPNSQPMQHSRGRLGPCVVRAPPLSPPGRLYCRRPHTAWHPCSRQPCRCEEKNYGLGREGGTS